MSARHVVGVVVGLAAPFAIAAPAMYGVGTSYERLVRYVQTGTASYGSLALIGVAGVLIGLLTGSRISPLAALIPGAVFTGYGAIWIVRPASAVNLIPHLPSTFDRGYQTLGGSGALLLAGIALLASALFPSRWRSTTTGPVGRHSYEYGVPETTPPAFPIPPGPFAPPQGRPLERPDWANPPPGPPPLNAP
ncbi:MAG: hypothetical protein JWN00_1341 [Actinomycetia bacterium]|nr:hypothetical protein [Actinomycetes bacterium]